MQISQAVREKMLLALGLGLIATAPSAECAPAENGRPARPTQSTSALDEGKPAGPVSAPAGIAAAKDAGGAPGCYAPGPKDDGVSEKSSPRRHSRLVPVNYSGSAGSTATVTASGTVSGTASGTATAGTASSGKPVRAKTPGTCSSDVPPVVVRKKEKPYESCPACGRG